MEAFKQTCDVRAIVQGLVAMPFSTLVFASGLFLLAWRLLSLLEDFNFWTLRLRIAMVYEYIIIPYCLTLLFPAFKISWIISASSLPGNRILLGALMFTAAMVPLVLMLYRLRESQAYRRLRWKAWTGPSRTGILPRYSSYFGNGEDWAALESSVGSVTLHPVERFAKIATPLRAGTESDPTDLLKLRASLDEDTESFWIPRSEGKAFVYQPISADQSVSLLWGQNLKFRARCSRGIISIPRALLTTFPRLNEGLDARPICLACAILTRNKGLEPPSLVFNLEKNNSFRTFEESSLFWPRPAKSLRGYYRGEFERMFGLLGASYITAATELALLIADVPNAII